MSSMSRMAVFMVWLSVGLAAGPLMGQGTPKANAAKADQAKGKAKGQKPPEMAPPAQITPKRERPVAKSGLFIIGYERFTESDFIDFLPHMLPNARVEQARRNPQLMKEARRAYADQMLLWTLARRENLEQSQEFRKKVATATKALLVQEAIEKRLPNPEPTEAQIKAHYDKSKGDFKTEEKATARHILVLTKKDQNDESGYTDLEALTRIEAARKELNAGRDWSSVAKEYSDDPGSKDAGGIYEDFDPSGMVPEFANAVRTQKPGVVGGPVKTQFGYHTILVESYTPVRTQTYEEARRDVLVRLTNEMRVEAWTKFFEALRADLKFVELKADDGDAPPEADPQGGGQ